MSGKISSDFERTPVRHFHELSAGSEASKNDEGFFSRIEIEN
jgi:hypothetical protein